MEMTGERRIGAPREAVWAALNDPAVLKEAIPGCESVERIGDDQFQAKVSMKLGPMSAKFGGKVTLSNINPPASYTISGEGTGGAMGFAKGGADVALDEVGPSETLLRYNVKAQVGGKMAQLGARLIDSTAKSMADQFFDRFAAQLAPAAPVAVAGTDTEYLAGSAEAAPITQHGAEGQSPGGPVHKPNPTTGEMPLPLRLLTQDFMGFPAQVWFGGAAMVVILALIFLVG
ncbi:SRPBCC family protein [Falsiroseomonas ponticola]|jgi:carbon monoxide dehydrogenase subunit G|uniref:SRPBCC family protein n=1 Tax=Falsiroseomonas ponticola TaxID=2786951 RepID=UPI001CF771F7|nr:carbon monoxide dehydrogenase subunit G [Roseomonas ponticola]